MPKEELEARDCVWIDANQLITKISLYFGS